MEEALCLDVITQATSALVVGLGKELEQGPTAVCRAVWHVFSGQGCPILWRKKIQLLPDKGSIRIMPTFCLHISYSVPNAMRKSLLSGPVAGRPHVHAAKPSTMYSCSSPFHLKYPEAFCKLMIGNSHVISQTLLPVWGNASWQNHVKE